ncbi:arylalkylamine N-acetyltransferase 1-like isoform X2 [Anthonomus grandis grandis]|nr:arylalkylamine N-acetyltransferase 1-like isoform X2 [Anthonomus grandis grandis]XP_050299237.1 arylalkylamine N-acetyltransferase 1-like isoform X2 [Anthonomus grandis grandis]XP_050299239.1 arylalkylamine N-acetyltransferase 1-like isoform X2 [Anthonomus grandis grandis]XP_050299240.1 arylalkylamine N-acetyltransferase 1-like isoform X2 [Anthonomus grandis grandis]
MASPPTTPVSPKEYDIVVTTASDKEDILNFLREFFFRDEPLNKYLDLINENNPRCKDLEYFSTKNIDNGLNLKAIHNGKIIGVCLNDLLKRGYLQDPPDEHEITDPKFSKIVRMLGKVEVESDIFSKFPDSDTAMTTKILTVNNAYRGQGIAKELLNKTREMAKELGAGFMSVDCTSHFTALALKKLGFECIYTLRYADHKENGEVVFKPEPPHESVTVYVQKIM